MKLHLLSRLALALSLTASLPLTTLSCREKGTAQKIGEKIDRGAEKVGEKLEEGAAKVEDVVKDALDSRPNEPARDAAERGEAPPPPTTPN